MPVGFDPSDTCLIALDCVDKGRPDASRVRFRCRFLSHRDEKAIARMRAAAYEPGPPGEDGKRPEKTDEQVRDGLIKAIEHGITGWENLVVDGREIPFGPDGWEEFTFRQIERMAMEYPSAVYFSERDRKNSESPSPTPSARPAGGHAAAPPQAEEQPTAASATPAPQ